MTIAVLASGGVDSACLLEWAAKKCGAPAVLPLYVSFGLRWESAEWLALRRFLRAWAAPGVRQLVRISIPAGDVYRNHWSITGRRVPGKHSPDSAVYLPGRNLMMLAKSAVYCARNGISRIAVGTLAANPFPDAGLHFFRAFSLLASIALRRPIRVVAPFRRMRKRDLIRRYSSLPLRLCFSCLNPNDSGRPCGRCNKCFERVQGFKGFGS